MRHDKALALRAVRDNPTMVLVVNGGRMPGLALSERRPWLLASLMFGISYWFAGPNTVPGVYLIAWKGAGVGLLAAYAWAHHPSRGAHLIALVLAFGAIGDMVLEIDFTIGALTFLAGHLLAIGLYVGHRRPNAITVTPIALLAGIPLGAYLLTGAPTVALYALAPEREQRAGMRTLLQHLLRQHRKAIEALAHVGRPACQPHPDSAGTG
jgi:YhhN family